MAARWPVSGEPDGTVSTVSPASSAFRMVSLASHSFGSAVSCGRS